MMAMTVAVLGWRDRDLFGSPSLERNIRGTWGRRYVDDDDESDDGEA